MRQRAYLLCITLLTGLMMFTSPAQAKEIVLMPSPPDLSATAHILVDFHTSKTLSQKNADLRVPPASLTKMMTMYVIDYELAQGRLALDETVLVSEKAWRAQGSRMFIEVGSRPKVADLIKGIIIQSGNDASIAMAEHIAGSEEAFVALMNQHAKALGMNNTHFENVTGLPADNHYSSARDMATLAQALIQEYPESYALYSQKWFTYNGIKQPNRNRLLWRNDHVDGIKTGNTDDAGYCLVASAKKNNMRLVSVLMGASDDDNRTEQSNRLISYGFRFFETHHLFAQGEVLKQPRVWMGASDNVPIGVDSDVLITIPQGHYDDLEAKITLDSALQAPLAKGHAVGTLSIYLGDELITQAPLVSFESVDSGNTWHKMSDYISMKMHHLSGQNS